MVGGNQSCSLQQSGCWLYVTEEQLAGMSTSMQRDGTLALRLLCAFSEGTSL